MFGVGLGARDQRYAKQDDVGTKDSEEGVNGWEMGVRY